MIHFSNQLITTSETTIFARTGGAGPPLLLLHGFPETHYMWRRLAPLLAKEFTVIMADLRGYGQSGCPPSTKNHAPYSKRAMARDMIELMRQLGFSDFAVAGHDRGGRVAYRMALDYPRAITQLIVLDIMPTGVAWEKADDRMMLGFWPWTLFAQPAPLPERILQVAAEEIVANACDNWGSSADTFPAEIRKLYVEALQSAAHVHAICEEYRAAATIDREHDMADQQAQHTIVCPTMVLWSANGALDTWYTDSGGPLSFWRTLAPNVQGEAMSGGHFFPEENPQGLYQKLQAFLTLP